ncbi:MAG TPA: YdcF family protein [Candidatus Acidoferrales bacterium]
MAQNNTSVRTHPRRRAGFILLLLLLALAIFAFRNVGHWLTRQDALGPADCIVVLSGGLPYRAEGAAEIFKAGYAPEVWISLPAGPQAALKELGIDFVGEEKYDREVLVHQGLPESKISIFPREIVNTEEEVAEIAQEMRAQGKSTVIIVTSPEHTRRVRALWNALADKNLKAIVRAAPTDPFDADHWWRTTRDSLAVARETLGLLNVWSGLPIRPRT